MYAIDPWENQPSGNETYSGWNWSGIYGEYLSKTEPYKDRVIELMMYSHEAVDHVEDQSLDFVFIDAQHDYHSVKKDIELWAPKVKPGGLISGHDYDPKFPGVIQAVDESFNVEVGRNFVWRKI